jgi:hypothetical protein
LTNDLVDKTARAIYETFCARLYPNIECVPWDGIDAEYREDLRAEARAAITMIRPEVLEEAAKVAEGARTEAAGSEYQSGKPGDFWDRDSIYGCGREDAAAAIRAMIQRSQP